MMRTMVAADLFVTGIALSLTTAAQTNFDHTAPACLTCSYALGTCSHNLASAPPDIEMSHEQLFPEQLTREERT